MRGRTLGLRAALCALGVAGAAAPARADFDLAKDFSIAANPNGAWTYGYENSLGDTLNVYGTSGTTPFTQPDLSTSNLQYWKISPDAGPPVIEKNTSSEDIRSGTVVVPAFSTVLHPGPGGQYSVARLTLTAPGTYDLTATFNSQDVAGATTDVHVLINGVSQFDGRINYDDMNNRIDSPTASFAGTFVVPANSTIDFAVGYGINGYSFDSTGVSANVKPVFAAPEPSGVVMLATGILPGLAAWRRWAKAKVGAAV